MQRILLAALLTVALVLPALSQDVDTLKVRLDSLLQVRERLQAQFDSVNDDITDIQAELARIDYETLSSEGVEIEIHPGSAMLRNEPRATPPLATIPSGTRLKAKGYVGEYLKGYWYVVYKGQAGYVADAYVRRTPETERFKETTWDERTRQREEAIRNEQAEIERRIEAERMERQKRATEEAERMRQLETERAEKLRQAIETGPPLVIESVKPLPPNSADGVDVVIRVAYHNKKTIKYAQYTMIPYNAVGDVQVSDIRGHSVFTGLVTGPIEASLDAHGHYWETAWYNNTITCLKLTKIEIEYMDGTKGIYVQDLPQVLGPDVQNDCSYAAQKAKQ